MKSLLFDLYSCQPIRSSKYHGGGEYGKAVLKELISEYRHLVALSVFYNHSLFIDDWLFELIEQNNITLISISEYNDVRNILETNNYDVFYSPNPRKLDKKWFGNSTQILGTIHGVRFLELPWDKYEICYIGMRNKVIACTKYLLTFFCAHKLLYKYMHSITHKQFSVLDTIFTVSLYSSYSIKRLYPQYSEKLQGIYYPPPKILSNRQDNTNLPFDIKNMFILILGSDRWVKNSYRALKAIKFLYQNYQLKCIQTVVIGKASGIMKNNFDDNRFIFINYVNSKQLESLYKNCHIFFYPSLNEGFGYPPVEAMKYGKTCVVSGVCSIPEVCGDAAYYVNPYDISEMSTKVLLATENIINREYVIERYRKITEKQNRDLHDVCDFITKA